MLDRVRHRPLGQRLDQSVGHAVRDHVEIVRPDGVALDPGKSGLAGMEFAGRIEPGDLGGLVDHLQAAADMHRGGRRDLAFLDQRQLGGAAPDIDIEDALVLVVRHPRGAGAERRQERFHVMPGGGADELAALLGQDAGDALRVLAPQRLAGQDHGAGIDIVGMQARARIGVVDDLAERRIVDALLALVGRQRHRRLVEGLARDHVVAAGEILAVAAQLDAGEDDLRAGRADIDTDAHQRHVILQPDRILLERTILVELEMIVIVIGFALVLVDEVLPQGVVGERMTAAVWARAFFVLVVVVLGVGHQALSLNPLLAAAPSRAPGKRPSAGRTAMGNGTRETGGRGE